MVPSRGARGARLGVIEGNEPAQALYRWVGFAEYSEMNLYVPNRVKELTDGRQTPTISRMENVVDFPIATVGQ